MRETQNRGPNESLGQQQNERKQLNRKQLNRKQLKNIFCWVILTTKNIDVGTNRPIIQVVNR